MQLLGELARAGAAGLSRARCSSSARSSSSASSLKPSARAPNVGRRPSLFCVTYLCMYVVCLVLLKFTTTHARPHTNCAKLAPQIAAPSRPARSRSCCCSRPCPLPHPHRTPQMVTAPLRLHAPPASRAWRRPTARRPRPSRSPRPSSPRTARPRSRRPRHRRRQGRGGAPRVHREVAALELRFGVLALGRAPLRRPRPSGGRFFGGSAHSRDRRVARRSETYSCMIL